MLRGQPGNLFDLVIAGALVLAAIALLAWLLGK
jgi:hypothetical protein